MYIDYNINESMVNIKSSREQNLCLPVEVGVGFIRPVFIVDSTNRTTSEIRYYHTIKLYVF